MGPGDPVSLSISVTFGWTFAYVNLADDDTHSILSDGDSKDCWGGDGRHLDEGWRGDTQVKDSIAWVRCASGNVLSETPNETSVWPMVVWLEEQMSSEQSDHLTDCIRFQTSGVSSSYITLQSVYCTSEQTSVKFWWIWCLAWTIEQVYFSAGEYWVARACNCNVMKCFSKI